MSSRRILLAAAALLLAVAVDCRAADEEGCLFCHRLELVKALGSGNVSLRVPDTKGWTHEALYCSDCHPDARSAPHSSTPGPARCIEECHASNASALAVHRRASFGGLTETHRKAAIGRSPCTLCHRADDRKGDRETMVARCAACHETESRSVAAGVHGGVRGSRSGICAECHKAHVPAGIAGGAEAAAATISCAGAGCHANVTEGMRRHGGHGSGKRPGRGGDSLAEAALLLAFAALGWIPGKILGVGKNRGGSG